MGCDGIEGGGGYRDMGNHVFFFLVFVIQGSSARGGRAKIRF